MLTLAETIYSPGVDGLYLAFLHTTIPYDLRPRRSPAVFLHRPCDWNSL